MVTRRPVRVHVKDEAGDVLRRYEDMLKGAQGTAGEWEEEGEGTRVGLVRIL